MISDTQKAALVEAACAARENAYAPYSNYKVGAAILVADGQIITGINIENVSYGLTVCAERTAIYNAISAGIKEIKAIAVCTSNAVSPCGACRQVLAEFAGDIPVIMTDPHGYTTESTLHTLLPECFTPGHLLG